MAQQQPRNILFFRAIMLPSNEVPAVDIAASGMATVIAHVVRDSSGQITSGSVDFNVSFRFPGAVTITGLHIHPGAAGTNGPVAINSGVSGANPVTDKTGSSGMPIQMQGQVRPDDQLALSTLRMMVADPSSVYINLHTTDNPGGVIRGQLMRADVTVLMGLMSPLNEVPAITDVNASAVGLVIVLTTRDSSGAINSGQVTFDVNFRFDEPVTITGLHIHHPGPAGVNAGVVISSGLAGGDAALPAPTGRGEIVRPVEVNVNNAAQLAALQDLLTNPANTYINIHTTVFPGGVARAQLRRTDLMVFDVNMLPSNEVPPIPIDASAPAEVLINTLRAEDGSVVAGAFAYSVNFRFPGQTEFTGLHIHDGAAGVNGPVTLNSGLSGTNSVKTDTGFGNIFRFAPVTTPDGLATLNSLVRNPENHYINLHTTVNPGGVVRSQLAPANTAPPVVRAVISAVGDATLSTAPLGLISIFGDNLAKVTTDLSGWEGKSVPDLLNGVAVAAGGQRARLLFVSPTQVNAELAAETPTGPQLLSVNNGNTPSAPFRVNVADVAPAIFFTPNGGVVVKASDFSLIGADNPARSGDVLVIFVTGLGQTSPALSTGQIVPLAQIPVSALLTVTIGGQNADIISAVASPGLVAGVYQIAVRVPAGVAAGNAAVVVRSGSTASNSVNIAVQ